MAVAAHMTTLGKSTYLANALLDDINHSRSFHTTSSFAGRRARISWEIVRNGKDYDHSIVSLGASVFVLVQGRWLLEPEIGFHCKVAPGKHDLPADPTCDLARRQERKRAVFGVMESKQISPVAACALMCAFADRVEKCGFQSVELVTGHLLGQLTHLEFWFRKYGPHSRDSVFIYNGCDTLTCDVGTARRLLAQEDLKLSDDVYRMVMACNQWLVPASERSFWHFRLAELIHKLHGADRDAVDARHLADVVGKATRRPLPDAGQPVKRPRPGDDEKDESEKRARLT